MSSKNNYTDYLAKTYGGRWTYKNKRWSCDDGRRYVSKTGNLFNESEPPVFHMYGAGNPKIILSPIVAIAQMEADKKAANAAAAARKQEAQLV